jgi:hypothetical protein
LINQKNFALPELKVGSRHTSGIILLTVLVLTAYFLPFPRCYPLFLSPVFASDEPFVTPSNWGGTGLLEIPTARVMRENSYRIGVGQVKPYRYYYGAISPLKGLEIEGRVTEIMGVPALTPAYGNYKDKAIDFKYQFLPEGKYTPALALGIMDPQGTRVYSSQYIVASKQIYPFDFTIGFGNGRFGKNPDVKDRLKDLQFFWGIQFRPSPKYALMIEYSPIKYHRHVNDPAHEKYFREPVPSKYNFGIRYKPTKWSEIDLSYQRGKQIGINLSLGFDIGRPIIPIYDRIYQEKPDDKLDTIFERLTRALYHSGFSDIVVFIEGDELWIETQNEKYFYNTKAIGIILRILAKITPQNIQKVHIILKENNIPIFEFTTTMTDIIDLYTGRLTINEFLFISRFDTEIMDTTGIIGKHRKPLRYGLRPSFETFLNDPSGFFKYRFGLSGWMSYHPWSGATLITGIATYPINNISSTVEPLSIPVRSDTVYYKRERINLDKLMFNQVKRLTPKLYGRIATGLLEVQYAGVDAEVAMPLMDGRILVGLSSSAVKKRDPAEPFRFKSNDVKNIYTTAFLNTRLHIPEKEITIDVKAGRFLAGDNGVRFTISKFIYGVIIRAWYSFTDTSIFNDEFNKGYHDKGISISIPIRLFKGVDSRASYDYSISPWTRDTGQDIEHFDSLFDFIGRNLKIFLDKDGKMMY